MTNKELLPKGAFSLKVGDMITGYGTAVSVAHLYDLWGEQVAGKRIIIQGWGNWPLAPPFISVRWALRLLE